MGGISGLLETARRALLAQQFGISVTGHNIANASTAGYSRQRADLVATTPEDTAFGLLGTGVTVASVTRLHDEFIGQQIRTSNSALEAATAEYNTLSQVESTFNEPSDTSMSGVLSDFFSAWQDLSTDPESAVSRNALMLKGKTLADTFHRLYSETNTLRTSLRDELSAKVEQINALAGEISDLNVNIVAATASGFNAADLKDLRDTKIDELSKLANITVSQDSKGASLISVGGTMIGGNSTHLNLKVASGTAATVEGTSFDQLRVVTDSGGAEVGLTSGEAGSILKSYNTTIPGTLGRLNQLASALISAVNAQHSAGYGDQSTPQTGINFFMGTDASTIAIDLTNPSAAPGSSPSIDNIAASASAASPGDNSVALAIAQIISTHGLTSSSGVTLLGGLSLSEYYNQTVTNIGSAVNGANTLMQSQQLVVSNLAAQQDSVAGVSLDEEMTNMILFQHAYESAAKIVSTVNEMYTTLLDMV
jgi:flagellar hook-associated protein 1 FlgK